MDLQQGERAGKFFMGKREGGTFGKNKKLSGETRIPAHQSPHYPNHIWGYTPLNRPHTPTYGGYQSTINWYPI